MKKQFYLKSLMLLCMLFVGMGAWAETLTVDFESETSAYTDWTFTNFTTKQTDTNVTAHGGSFFGTTGGKTSGSLQTNEKIAAPSSIVCYVSKSSNNTTSSTWKVQVSSNGTSWTDVKSQSATSMTRGSWTEFTTDLSSYSNVYVRIYYTGTTAVRCIDDVALTYSNNDDGGGSTPSVTAPVFDVAAGTYTEDQLVLIDNYSSDYLYAYTTDGTDPAFDENFDVTNGTLYDENEGIEITSSCTLKAIAIDDDGNISSVTSAAYVINKPIVFASLEDLVAADLTTGTMVTVSFENVPIKAFQTVSSTRKGVYFDIQKGGNDIEIYFNSAVPAAWVEGGTLSGTLTNCPWKLYSSTWELAPASGWAWTNLTYNAPAQKEITSLTLTGEPTKTVYHVGETFDPAGLTVTAYYSDDTNEDVTSRATFYGVDEPLTFGTTQFETYATYNYVDTDVETYTISVIKKEAAITIANVELGVGEYIDITATTTPADAVLTYTVTDGSEFISLEGNRVTGVAAGTATVKASYAGNAEYTSAEKSFNVTVNNLKTASITSFSTTSGNINSDISYQAFKGNAGTAPAVYNNNLRLYQNGGYVTVKAAKGLKIASVKITTSATYATTVGYCVDDNDAPTTGATVAKNSDYTISDLDNRSVSIYCLGADKDSRLEISSIVVKYSGTPVAELKNIALSGTYPTEFSTGDTFSHEGMVVTANYTDNTNKDVTSSATFTGYNMSESGEQTVTVSYTEDDITKTAEYTINVTRVLVAAAEGYEYVDFTELSPYKDLTTNGSIAIEEYFGSSFDMAFAKSAGSTAPKYYQNGNAVRVYTNNTVTITGAEDIEHVGINWAGNYVDNSVSITGLGTKTAVVTFSQNCRFTDITVNYRHNHTRSVAANELYTICLPNAVEADGFAGAKVYNIAGVVKSGEAITNVMLEEEKGKLVAGKPYIIEGTADTFNAYYFGAPVAEAVAATGLVGNLSSTPVTVEDGNYIIGDDNKLHKVNGATVTVRQYRAYINLEGVAEYNGGAAAKMMGVYGTETGISSIEALDVDAPVYNVAGQRVTPTTKGILIQNGKKFMNK